MVSVNSPIRANVKKENKYIALNNFFSYNVDVVWLNESSRRSRIPIEMGSRKSNEGRDR